MGFAKKEAEELQTNGSGGLQEANSNTPAEELATIVCSALAAAGLVRRDRVDEVRSSLATGSARSSDWIEWIEEAWHAESRER